MPSASAEQCTLELHPVPAEYSWWRTCPWCLSPILALSCHLGICTGQPTVTSPLSSETGLPQLPEGIQQSPGWSILPVGAGM